MSSAAKESICQCIRELQTRLEAMKRAWSKSLLEKRPKWKDFRAEWSDGWRQIMARLREIDEVLNRQLAPRRAKHPAILPFTQ